MVLTLPACGGHSPAGAPEPRRVAELGRPLEVYRELGLMAGPEAFPVVGGHHAVAGPSDSTLLLFGLSFPATALRFQRDGAGFTAEYVVALRFSRDGGMVRLVDHREAVRVPSFAETARTDEAVVFQTAVPLEPGRYAMTVRVRDAQTARGLEASDTVDVPAFGAGALALAAPILVHYAVTRGTLDASPDLVLNARQTVPYGGAPPRVYIEAYAGIERAWLILEDRAGARLWRREVELAPGPEVRSAVIEVPTDDLPLGRFQLWVEADGGLRRGPVPLVVALSDRWLVSNVEEVLDLLGYIAGPEELQELARGTAEERRERWETFWAARDPVPASPGNEFRETFFERVRVVMDRFAEPGRPGWRSDRGEVYIVLGPPTRLLEREVGRGAGPGGAAVAQEWVYDGGPHGRLSLLFVDRTGLGRYELTASSRSAFRAAARRLRLLRTPP